MKLFVHPTSLAIAVLSHLWFHLWSIQNKCLKITQKKSHTQNSILRALKSPKKFRTSNSSSANFLGSWHISDLKSKSYYEIWTFWSQIDLQIIQFHTLCRMLYSWDFLGKFQTLWKSWIEKSCQSFSSSLVMHKIIHSQFWRWEC